MQAARGTNGLPPQWPSQPGFCERPVRPPSRDTLLRPVCSLSYSHGGGQFFPVYSSLLQLKRDPGAELNLAARSCGLGDDPELRGVHKPAGRSQIRMIERVEKLCSELELRLFSHVEFSGHGEIERLHSRSDDRIPPHIPEGESRG